MVVIKSIGRDVYCTVILLNVNLAGSFHQMIMRLTMSNNYCFQQIVTSSYTDLQDYTYYFVPAPWLCVKLLKLLQMYAAPGEISFWVILICDLTCENVPYGLLFSNG